MKEHDLSFAEMAKRAGISDASIHRLINGDQGTSLAAVETVIARLDVTLADIFPNHVSELSPADIQKAKALRISKRR